MKVKIYCLKDPRDGAIRYVGKTVQKLRCRLASHFCRDRNEKNYTEAWIKALKNEGIKPIIELIEEVAETVWEAKEKYYIQYYKELGYKLTNHSIGGDSCNLGCRWKIDDKSGIRKLRGRTILVFTPDMEFVEELESIMDFHEKYDVSQQNIYRRIDTGLPIRKMLVYRKQNFKEIQYGC